MDSNKPTLVVLAAGIGSRYGGLKQLDTFTPEGDTIIDFSIYDALEAGFGKFVFIIRKSIEKEFRAEIDPKLSGKAEVEYVFQEIDKVPQKYFNPDRVKPYGTGHAMLMAKDAVKENFAIINADDFEEVHVGCCVILWHHQHWRMQVQHPAFLPRGNLHWSA